MEQTEIALTKGSKETCDRAIAEVAAHSASWAATTPKARAVLLDRVIRDTAAAADGWLADACFAKGLAPRSPEAGEELFAGVITFVRMARLFRDSMLDIDRFGAPKFPGPVTDHRRIRVFPNAGYDKVLYQKMFAEVWIEENKEMTQAGAYKDPKPGLSLVLGAGNVASLGPRDVLWKLFGEGKVVVLKANPVNDYLVSHWNRAMRALIDAGVLRIVSGDALVGEYLVGHKGVDEVHITGSNRTHDAVVFGTGEEGAKRKAANNPVLEKFVSCELGNVSPVIIAPGNWDADDIKYQAEHVATMLVNNAGFNCLTPRVLLTYQKWPQRHLFISALAQVLAEIPTRRAYYPGAETRRNQFLSAHPDAWLLGASTTNGQVFPWTFVSDVPAGNIDDICYKTEAFCGLMAETAIDASSPEAFLDAAVEFCNNVLWGTLSATLIARPDPSFQPVIDRAVKNLKYGALGVNVWHATAFALGQTTWGAYPRHVRSDIQSGIGTVGNAFLFDHPEKSVVYGPFRSRPKPPWFATHKRAYFVMRRLLDFEVHPSIPKMAAVLGPAVRP